ncbi:MAG: PSD1 domain-containing protein [Planctomycetia bacterium]|nr:PSD1 domain-containing protein [Planctomycetia bacterium]
MFRYLVCWPTVQLGIGWLVLVLGSSLAHGGELPVPSFEQDVRPLLAAHCFQCHGEKELRNQLDLRTRASTLKGGKTGAAVVPGSLRESLLWGFIATDKMPATETKLTDDQKEVIRRWVLAGAPATVAAAQQTITAPELQPSANGQKPRGLTAMVQRIDQLIDERLRAAQVGPSPRADDAEFLRRVYLDLTGRIPTYEQTTSFLQDETPDKRARLIDQLLASPAYGEHFGLIWERLLVPKTSEVYRNIPHGEFQAWLADGFNRDRGWNAIVSDLITATGKVPSANPNQKTKGPSNVAAAYVVGHTMDGRPQPKLLAATSTRLFLGQSIECAQCHNHPLARWRRTDFWGVAAFFERTRYPSINQGGGEVIEPGPREGRELVYSNPKAQRFYRVPAVRPEPVIAIEGANGQPSDRLVRARFLGGIEPDLKADGPHRPAFAAWLTAADNPWFARAMVNRTWGQLLGRGFVEPVDDMSEDNSPSHPELLQELAQEFSASGFKLKELIRCICRSQVYQRSSTPTTGNAADQTLYSHQALKEMTGAVLLRSLYIAAPALKEAHETNDKNKPAVIAARTTFLEMFDEGDSHPAEYSRGLQEALRLMNGEGKVFTGEALKPILAGAASPREAVRRIYLLVLSREPREAELTRMLRHIEKYPGGPRADPLGDVYWVLLNSAEFMFNH